MNYKQTIGHPPYCIENKIRKRTITRLERQQRIVELWKLQRNNNVYLFSVMIRVRQFRTIWEWRRGFADIFIVERT